MKEAFEQRSDEFKTPEKRVVRQMVFETAEQALAARNAIDSGTEFGEVAETLLGLTNEDIFLGELTFNDLDVSMADSIFNAEVGALVGPIESLFGYNLAIVDVIILGSNDSFDDVKEQINVTLGMEKAIDLVYEKINLIEDALGTGSTLEEVALQNGLTTQTINNLDKQGNNIDGEAFVGPESDIISMTDFLETSWSTDIEEVSTLIDAGNDTFFVLKPIKEYEPRERSFEEVEERVTSDFLLEIAIASAKLQAQNHMRIGPSIFEDIDPTSPFRRSGVGLDNSDARLIAQTAFEQPIDAAKLVETGKQVLIIKTAGIVPASETEVTDTTNFYLSQLNLAASKNISDALSVSLSERHKLELYPGMVQQILVGQNN
jgi:peptidyl-prolyl cis-trans isomerase D